MRIFGKEFTFNGFKIYHAGDKPTPSDIGAAKEDHGHNYAGSSSDGGSATSAVKLDSSAGSATQPVYFSNGKPVKTTYTLKKSVPSDAVFTDTTYEEATDSEAGLLSAEGKKKLDDLEKIPYVEGTQTASTGTWTGTASKLSNLKDGQAILYWLPYAGSGNATLNLTLADGSTTGAINCYYKGSTRLTTHFSAGSIILLTYKEKAVVSGTTIGAGWWAVCDYNSDSKVSQPAAITTAGEYPVLLAYSTATTAVTNAVKKTSTLKYNPNTKVLTAPTFKGALSGNADSATKATKDGSGNNIEDTYALKDKVGVKVYVSDTEPTGAIAKGSLWF